MTITRHYLTIDGRRVHYRKCGSGPPLLMVHQSPRSSAEYTRLMKEWGAHFTCIAPDTPGFGQSDPLAKADADINDFADAVVQFSHALGLAKTAAYGFHSGGIILVTAMKRHPELFSCLAVGGYAIWTEAEMDVFGASYLPPFQPMAYGEHLIWLWNRILEQSWFFPWFDVCDEARLPNAHDDPARVHAIVMEMLDAGDAYRTGYGAVLRAPRDIPPADAMMPPVLISAYDGDPLQAHIDRLGELPPSWSAQKVSTPREHEDLSLTFLKAHPSPVAAALAEDDDSGWALVRTNAFEGLIHWRGDAVDPPGHGLSDGWNGKAPEDWQSWQAVFDGFKAATGRCVTLPPLPNGDPDLLYPDLTPDRFGAHLTRAWSIARAAVLFDPWYQVSAGAALPVEPARITPETLAIATRDLLRATAAKSLHKARLTKEDR